MSVTNPQTRTKQECKFFLLRYAPNPVRDEFVNIGLVLLAPQAPPELRFSKDWSRVRALDPQADTELLDAFRNEISAETAGEETRDAVLRRIEDSFSNILQTSTYKACLTASPQKEADELARIYLEAPRRRSSREKGARLKIFHSMQTAFTQAGVWKAMQKKIPASRYSRPGDPLEIDCAYRTDSTIKMFQATSLRADVTAAKALAFTYPELAAGIQRIEGARTYLTAIVEDGLEQSDEITYAIDALERQAIQVATVSHLPELAALAAIEIGRHF